MDLPEERKQIVYQIKQSDFELIMKRTIERFRRSDTMYELRLRRQIEKEIRKEYRDASNKN